VNPILLALALQAATPPSPQDEALYRGCVNAVKRDANQAVQQANDWRLRGGGIYARVCLGMAYAALERWEPAATAFEQAAREAEMSKDARGSDLWAQAGNAWLAVNDALQARAAFDAALVIGKMTPALRGEILLDRARAGVALNDLATARADLDKGLELVPGDPFGWYLSAALAIRQEAVPRARQDITKAVQLAPDDAEVLLLAGNVAGMTGDAAAARGFYERAIKASPNSAAAKQAQKQLQVNSTDDPNAPTGPVPEDDDEPAAAPQPTPRPRPAPTR